MSLDNILSGWESKINIRADFIKDPNIFIRDVIGVENVLMSFKGERYFKSLAPFQKFIIQYLFHNPKKSLFEIAARSSAKTWTNSLYATMRAYDNPAVNIAFVSGSLKQAQYSNNYMRAFFK